MKLTDKQRHGIEAGAVVALLLLLLWWLLRSSANPAPLNTTDPTGQSTQPNNFIPASFSVPPFSINVQNVQFPLSVGGGGNFPLYLDIPLVTYDLVVGGGDDCDCGTGNNCPVSPYTIASISKMEALGVAYGNAMISAANDTQEAILQQFANVGQNVYFVQSGPAIP